VNSVDFKVRQKTQSDGADCILGGTLFQTCSRDRKRTSPLVVRCIGGTTSADVDVHLRQLFSEV